MAHCCSATSACTMRIKAWARCRTKRCWAEPQCERSRHDRSRIPALVSLDARRFRRNPLRVTSSRIDPEAASIRIAGCARLQATLSLARCVGCRASQARAVQRGAAQLPTVVPARGHRALFAVLSPPQAQMPERCRAPNPPTSVPAWHRSLPLWLERDALCSLPRRPCGPLLQRSTACRSTHSAGRSSARCLGGGTAASRIGSLAHASTSTVRPRSVRASRWRTSPRF